MSFSLPSNATPPAPSALHDAIGRLRAESEAADSEVKKGILLHEIGVLEDLAKNDGQAARDLLGAVNSVPEFHEPLERLLVLTERRKSYKNLGKLVDRLAKIGATSEEQARSLIALGEFREDHDNDLAGAREAFEQATRAHDAGVDAWLALERIAAKTGDIDLRQKALGARARHATDPTWRALLSIDAARLLVAARQMDSAVEAILLAVDAPSRARYAGFLELERVGKLAGRPELVARALEQQAALIDSALGGSTDPDALSVPAARKLPDLAEAWLGAAEIHRARGDSARATSLLDKVVERMPDDIVAVMARLRIAEATGDTAAAAALSQRELGRGTKGPVAASLWMRVAEAAASTGDLSGALEALSAAVAEDSASVPARTLQLHLLGGGDPGALAQALEAAATQLGSEELGAELFLLAADSWARGARDVSATKAALSQAAASGASLDAVARTGRLLAAICADPAWFDEATRRLITTKPPDEEQASLWFELGRARLLRGDRSGAVEAFASLAGSPGGAWLGTVLRAYAAPLARTAGEEAAHPAPADGAALEALSLLVPSPEAGRAFGVAGALRFALSGQVDLAIEGLSRLHASDPGDLVVATALASLQRRQGQPREAARVLATSSEAVLEAPLSTAFLLEAGIVLWLAGERGSALERFEAAARKSPEAASGLFAWALRAAEPNDVGARRKALAAAEASEDAGLVALERFALEVGASKDPKNLRNVLGAARGEGPIGVALGLARLFASTPEDQEHLKAREAISDLGSEARGMVWGSAHFATLLAGADSKAAEASAAKWASVSESTASALEWLSHAVATGHRAAEIAARERLAECLGGKAHGALLASARLVARLANDDVESPLLAGKETDVLLTNLELSPPSCDPRRRATALLDAADSLDEPSRLPALSLAGWNLLAAGDAPGAMTAFRSALDALPEDLVGWEGLRAAAEATGNKELLAEASAALGDLASDPGQGAELWERAGQLLLDMGDPARAEAALSRAVTRDISRTAAFDRLFRIVRARGDNARLLDLVSARLAVAEDPDEIAKLYWERARALRESGDGAGALEALENVAMLEPDHVGALALTGEIYITEKRFAEAAQSLARLARLTGAPARQRLMSGMAATDLYENRLGQAERALEVLVGLHRAGLATLPVRERLARAAAKTSAWDTATNVLEELMEQREAPEGRIEAARLAMALHRDRLGNAARAERAVTRLLAEAPDDGEALDLVLTGALPKPLTRQLLERGRTATLDALVASPLDAEKMGRLAEIARRLDDVQLRQVTLGAVVALGGQTPATITELAALDGRVARIPQIAVDDSVIESLRDPSDPGPIAELVRALATTVTEALGPGLPALGVTKKERVRPQDGLPIRNEIAAWVGALGLGEFELYVGGRNGDAITAVATEVPSIVVGADVESPLGAVHRQALARELVALRLGTGVVGHRDASDVAALIVAACRVGGVHLDSPAYAMLGEFERLLSKEMPRRVKKMLPELAAPIADLGSDLVHWVHAARSSLDRTAAIAIGDVSWVLVSGAGGGGGGVTRRGEAPTTADSKERATRLLSFVLSATFFRVREKLGMGVK